MVDRSCVAPIGIKKHCDIRRPNAIATHAASPEYSGLRVVLITGYLVTEDASCLSTDGGMAGFHSEKLLEHAHAETLIAELLNAVEYAATEAATAA